MPTEDRRKRREVVEDGEMVSNGQIVRVPLYLMDAMRRGEAPPPPQRLYRPGQATLTDQQRGVIEAREQTRRLMLADRWRAGNLQPGGKSTADVSWVAKTDPATLQAIRRKRMAERYKLAGVR